MEPFRVIIDNFVYYNANRNLDKEYKLDLINIFNHTYKYENKMYTLKDIIKLYVKNALEILSNNELENYKEFIFYEG